MKIHDSLLFIDANQYVYLYGVVIAVRIVCTHTSSRQRRTLNAHGYQLCFGCRRRSRSR